MKKRYYYSDKRLGFSHRFDAKFGKLYPILVQLALPGDSFHITHDFTIRTIPQLAPLLSNINAYVATFKVPLRILFKKGIFESFLSGGDDYANASKWDDFHLRKVDITKVPPYDPADPTKLNGLGTDWDLVFNLVKDFGLNNDQGSSLIPNELYFQARTYIWDEFFRDENFQKKLYARRPDDGAYYDDDYRYNINGVNTDISPYSIFESLVDNTKEADVNYCSWGKDYFTSSLPFSQQGPSTKIPLNFLFSNFVTPQDSVSGATTPEYMTFIDKGYFGRYHELSVFNTHEEQLYQNGNRITGVYNHPTSFVPQSSVYTNGFRLKIYQQSGNIPSDYAFFMQANPFFQYLKITVGETVVFTTVEGETNPATNISYGIQFMCSLDTNGGISLFCVLILNFTSYGNNYSYRVVLSGGLSDFFSYSNSSYAVNPETGIPEAPTIDLKVLREGFDIQKFKERVATFAGGRYDEFMLGVFGVNLNSDIIGIPEVISRTKIPILSLEVSQTSATTGNQFLGSMAGKGLAVSSNKMGRIYCKEHSLIISLFYIRPKAEYEQGLRRDLSFETRFDFPFPDLLKTGLEPILRGEIYSTGGSDDDSIFGFTNKFEFLRRNYNKVSGNFRTGRFYAPWGLTRYFNNTPYLNDVFLSMKSSVEQGGPTNRIFESLEGNPFLIYVYNRVSAKRQLPYDSIPNGII